MILAAHTGRGHVSVMNSLKEGFLKNGYRDCICVPDFYESLFPLNKMMSDYYNYLLSSSIALCDKFVELNELTRPEKNEEIYQITKPKYVELLHKKGLEAIVSVATSINYNLIRCMKEEGVLGKIPFYIVVTDPYDPIAPGFDSKGADRYFCANDIVKRALIRNHIDEDKIVISGYPISEKFQREKNYSKNTEFYSNFEFDKDKKVILLNCGSQGNIKCLDYLRFLIKSEINANILVICGKNKALYKMACLEKKINKKDNIYVCGFIDNMDVLLEHADVYITKAGANSVYEALSMKTPILIDAIDGLVYQERGIGEFIAQYGIGSVIHSMEDLLPRLQDILYGEEGKRIKDRYRSIVIQNGCNKITRTIFEDIGFSRKVG